MHWQVCKHVAAQSHQEALVQWGQTEHFCRELQLHFSSFEVTHSSHLHPRGQDSQIGLQGAGERCNGGHTSMSLRSRTKKPWQSGIKLSTFPWNDRNPSPKVPILIIVIRRWTAAARRLLQLHGAAAKPQRKPVFWCFLSLDCCSDCLKHQKYVLHMNKTV